MQQLVVEILQINKHNIQYSQQYSLSNKHIHRLERRLDSLGVQSTFRHISGRWQPTNKPRLMYCRSEPYIVWLSRRPQRMKFADS